MYNIYTGYGFFILFVQYWFGTASQRWILEEVSEQVDSGMYFVRNYHSDQYLDVATNDENNMQNFQNVHRYTFHGKKNQQWYFTRLSNGYYKITAGSTNNSDYRSE